MLREREREYRYPLCWILFYCWNIINSLVTTADFQVIIVVRIISVKRQQIIMVGSNKNVTVNHSVKQNKEISGSRGSQADELIMTIDNQIAGQQCINLIEIEKHDIPNHQFVVDALQFQEGRNICRSILNNIVTFLWFLFFL